MEDEASPRQELRDETLIDNATLERLASDMVQVYKFEQSDSDYDDLVSTASGSTVTHDKLIQNRTYVTIARAFMQRVRGGIDGPSLPDFRVVTLHADSSVDDVESEPRVLSSGDKSLTDVVWHQISAGYTLLTAVEVEYSAQRTCHFCTARLSVGIPTIVLTHVCTFSGSQQRVQLAVDVTCATCASKRGAAPVFRKAPIMHVGHIFLLDRLTLHLQYILARHAKNIMNYKLAMDDSARACDACFKELSDESEFLLIACQNVEHSEYALFVTCSDKCKSQLSRNLECMMADSMRPTPANNGMYSLDTNLSKLPTPRNLPSSEHTYRLPDELSVGRWRILTDEQMKDLVLGKDSTMMAIGAMVVHRCHGSGCFCRSTHRGPIYKKSRASEKEKESIELPDNHFLLRKIYAQLMCCSLYIDVLGSDQTTRCIACNRPCERLCTECNAVRTCADRCAMDPNALKKHTAMCRPYVTAWTSFTCL